MSNIVNYSEKNTYEDLLKEPTAISILNFIKTLDVEKVNTLVDNILELLKEHKENYNNPHKDRLNNTTYDEFVSMITSDYNKYMSDLATELNTIYTANYSWVDIEESVMSKNLSKDINLIMLIRDMYVNKSRLDEGLNTTLNTKEKIWNPICKLSENYKDYTNVNSGSLFTNAIFDPVWKSFYKHTLPTNTFKEYDNNHPFTNKQLINYKPLDTFPKTMFIKMSDLNKSDNMTIAISPYIEVFPFTVYNNSIIGSVDNSKDSSNIDPVLLYSTFAITTTVTDTGISLKLSYFSSDLTVDTLISPTVNFTFYNSLSKEPIASNDSVVSNSGGSFSTVIPSSSNSVKFAITINSGTVTLYFINSKSSIQSYILTSEQSPLQSTVTSKLGIFTTAVYPTSNKTNPFMITRSNIDNLSHISHFSIYEHILSLHEILPLLQIIE